MKILNLLLGRRLKLPNFEFLEVILRIFDELLFYSMTWNLPKYFSVISSHFIVPCIKISSIVHFEKFWQTMDCRKVFNFRLCCENLENICEDNVRIMDNWSTLWNIKHWRCSSKLGTHNSKFYLGIIRWFNIQKFIQTEPEKKIYQNSQTSSMLHFLPLDGLLMMTNNFTIEICQCISLHCHVTAQLIISQLSSSYRLYFYWINEWKWMNGKIC